MYYTTIPHSNILSKQTQRMGFRLPDWTKVMYGSGAVKKHWEERVRRASNAWTQIEKLSLIEGLRDSILIYSSDMKETHKYADAHGLIVVPLSATSTNGYSSYGGGGQNGTPAWRCALVRTPAIAAEWMDIWGSEGMDLEVGRLLGYPECCRIFFHDFWVKQEWRDLTVPAWKNGPVESEDELESIFMTRDLADGPPESNILGRWNGIRLVSHMPCSFNCQASVEIGKQHAQIGRDHGLSEEVDLIYELLNMPYKYSSLHGITTITTPIWKVSTAGEPFPEEVVFERTGRTPDMASSGKKFPFNNAAKSIATDSPSFKRSIDAMNGGEKEPFANQLIRINELPEMNKNFHLNGFSTLEGQHKSHEMLLGVFEENMGSVTDLGCGNGSLLAKINRIYQVPAQGVEYNKEAWSDHLQFPNITVRQENLFQAMITTNTVILMIGRLIEQLDKRLEGDSSATINLTTLADSVSRCVRFLIVYGYSDWSETDFESYLSRWWDARGNFEKDWVWLDESDQGPTGKAQVYQRLEQ